MEIKVTVCTPAYNRESTLTRLYESLTKQCNKNFEWIVIDDGSTDNTQNLINSFMSKNNDFEIKYIKQENGGKHKALNKGIDLAKGKLILILDSDDYLVEDAIKIVIEKEKEISNLNYAGVAFSKGYDVNKLVGQTFKGDYIDCTSLERNQNNIKGDKCEVFYTEILRKYKFPEFENEKFIPEALVWNRIAKDGYKLRWFQDIIYICEYREDGLTKKGRTIYKNSPRGLALYINEYIQCNNLNILRRMLQYEHYSNSIYENKQINKAAKELKVKPFEIKCGIVLRKILQFLDVKR